MINHRPLRIAVADDDPRLRDFFQRALTMLGHHVVVLAADGEELVAGCSEHQPDLIITDVHMPRLNGVEAVQRVWREHKTPAILITGLPDGDLIAGSRAQTCVYLVKPVPLVELTRAISQLAMYQLSGQPAG